MKKVCLSFFEKHTFFSALKIQVFLVVRSSFFARQIPLVFYSSLDWEMSEQEKSSRDPPKESTLGKEMKS